MNNLTIWKTLSKKNSDHTVSDILNTLLVNRGLTSEKDILDFLTPNLDGLLNMQFADMQKALSRIDSAIKNHEKITVYSDYDADGISASAILWETLNDLNADVMPYIPDRLTEGYGFSKNGIKKVADTGVTLIISVDHGITAKEEINYARELGIDVILTDHHLKPDNAPEPYALIHTTTVCGAVIAWKLSYEIHKFFQIPVENIFEKLSIAAIATIADQMPMFSHNRAVVKNGLEYLRTTKRPGLVELFNVSNLKKNQIDEYHLGHVIAPRINAMGRLSDAIESLRLYCTNSQVKAKQLSGLLNETNIRRQELTLSGVSEAYKMVDSDKDLIILGSPNWHEGIIGLIAGRINDNFNKPTIIVSEGKTFSKGSARSVSGVDITDLLRQSSSNILEDVGGHTMAAGFTVKTTNLPKLKKSIENYFQKKYSNKEFNKEIIIDAEIDIKHINSELYESIQKLKPFGNSNAEPVFLLQKQKVRSISRIGADQSHIRIDLESISCIGFRLAEKSTSIRPGDHIDIIFTLNLNEFNGVKKLQLIIIDLAKSGDQYIRRT